MTRQRPHGEEGTSVVRVTDDAASTALRAGWLLGQSNVSVTTECYLNGEPIDWANVPY